MKRFLIALLTFNAIGLAVLISAKPAPQKPPPVFKQEKTWSKIPDPLIVEATFEDALKSISDRQLRKDVEYLTSQELEGRMSGKKGNVKAFAFLKQSYESFGLPTMYHRFPIRRLNNGPKNEIGDDFTQNVYAWIEGNELKDEVVVVGAHGDHIGYGPSMSQSPQRKEVHPGADDNASGTAALLSIAKAFSLLKKKVKRTIVFQSYSAEEMDLIGSEFYCNNPIFPLESPSIKKHIFMCNLDMVGRLHEGYYLVKFEDRDSSVDVGKLVNELSGKYPFAHRITSRGSSGSDHAPFYNKKVPIAFLHTGMHSQYHTPDDTADRINYEGLEKVSRYCFELVWKVAQGDKPEFNHTEFKEMPYRGDHRRE